MTLAASLLARGLTAFMSGYRPSSLTASRMMMSTAAEIPRVRLGSSDLVVSKVCLGTMTWGEQNTLEEGVEQLQTAFEEYGINFLGEKRNGVRL